MPRERRIFLNSHGPDLLELFLIAAVSSLLVIRAFLALSGYPQLGGNGLHISHMLWGGLLMAGALFLLLGLLGPAVQSWAAVIAGIGFGTFIDELGKFITSDHNYFYEPTIGIIYILFIALFLLLRSLRARWRLTGDESLANALNRLASSGGGPLSPARRQEVLQLLDDSPPAGHLAESLRHHVLQAETLDASRAGWYFRFRDGFLTHYRRVAGNSWFARLVIALFVVQTAGQLAVAAFLLGGLPVIAAQGISFAQGAQLVASGLAGLLILWGLLQMRTSRARAYPWLLRGVLVNIFVTQVFIFLEFQLAGISGLFWNILLYLALRFMAENEGIMSARAWDGTSPQPVAYPTN